jgi:hypothetical protein
MPSTAQPGKGVTMSDPLSDERIARAESERQRLRQAFPAEFDDGVARARAGDPLYPSGFHSWPLDRRNAWFGGFNVGYLDRKRGEERRGGGRRR